MDRRVERARPDREIHPPDFFLRGGGVECDLGLAQLEVDGVEQRRVVGVEDVHVGFEPALEPDVERAGGGLRVMW